MTSYESIAYNANEVLELVKHEPQTYETLLGDDKHNPTLQYILRRKMNRFIKNGLLCKSQIPFTSYGRLIFFANPKNYYIVFTKERNGAKTYYFTTLNEDNIKLWGRSKQLNGAAWLNNKERTLLKGDVIKIL